MVVARAISRAAPALQKVVQLQRRSFAQNSSAVIACSSTRHSRLRAWVFIQGKMYTTESKHPDGSIHASSEAAASAPSTPASPEEESPAKESAGKESSSASSTSSTSGESEAITDSEGGSSETNESDEVSEEPAEASDKNKGQSGSSSDDTEGETDKVGAAKAAIPDDVDGDEDEGEVLLKLAGELEDEDVDEELKALAEDEAPLVERQTLKRSLPKRPLEMLLDTPVCFTCGKDHWTFECDSRSFNDWSKWSNKVEPEALEPIIAKLKEVGAFVEERPVSRAVNAARLTPPVFMAKDADKDKDKDKGKHGHGPSKKDVLADFTFIDFGVVGDRKK